MEMRRVFTAALALCLTLSMAVPASASEVGLEPETIEMSQPQPETVEPSQPEPSESPLPQEPVSVLPVDDSELSVAAPVSASEAEPEPETVETSQSETVEASQPEPSEGLLPQGPVSVLPVEGLEVFDSSDVALLAASSAVIDVTVPNTGKIVVNPYRLTVETDEGRELNDQIVCDPLEIVNDGEYPIMVDASIVGSVSDSSSAQFVTSEPTANAQKKQIFLYAEFSNEEENWSNSYDSTAANQILVKTTSTSGSNVLTVEDGETGWFRFFGSTTAYPAEVWCADDTFTVTVTFTFKTDTSTVSLDSEPETEGILPPENGLPLPETDSATAEDGPMFDQDSDTLGETDLNEVQKDTDKSSSDKAPEIQEKPEGNPTPDIPKESEPEMTPEISEKPEADPTPEVPEESESETTPEIPEKPEADPTPEVLEKPDADPTPEIPEESEPETTPEIPEKAEADPTPEAPEEAEPETTPEISEKAEADPTPEAPKEAKPETTPEIPEKPDADPTPEAPKETKPEPSPGAVENPSPDSTPETAD